MKQHLARLIALAFVITLPALASAQDASGIWRTESSDQGYLEVQVAPCGGKALCGTILRARDLTGTEQPYPHTGNRMIRDMQPDGPGRWSKGRIWDPRIDRTFNSHMTLAGNRLKVSGCLLSVCQEQTWQRLR